MKILLAGASGVVGRRLVPLLVGDGHAVVGITRTAGRADMLRALGAEPLVVDVFDAAALRAAVVAARPEVVIHQLTDLPDTADPAAMAAARERNSRIRIEGTRNLVDAALAAGASRLIAQSIAFAYADGPEPHRETDALAAGATGVRALEDAVLGTPGITGIVLRYGRFYGPGTWTATPERGPLHVDAAAQAARLAVTRGAPGAYNIAEDDGALTIEKAKAAFGFDPGFRLPPGQA
jgi:nucleoside-diphosphate-sugar epimerase